MTQLWLCPADGTAAPRQITSSKAAPSGPTWSPDSKKVAFSARRDGDDAPQIYALDLALGGDAERLTRIPGGARSPQWSPDGSTLLFVSDVAPPHAVRSAALMRTYDSFPVRRWDRWLDEKKPHLFVQNLLNGEAARDTFSRERGSRRRPGTACGSRTWARSSDLTWTPDSRSVVFAANTNENHAAFSLVPAQLFSVALAGGEPTPLTRGDDSYSSPLFTPDGKTLLARVEKGGDGRVYHHARLVAFGWPQDWVSSRRILTDSLDLSVGGYGVSPDSRTAYFTAETDGHDRLFSVSVEGGAVRAYGLPSTGGLTNLAMGGSSLVADFDSSTSPAELVRIDPASGTFRPLSALNAARLATLDLSPAESFTFVNSKGRPVQSFLIRPTGFDPARKYPASSGHARGAPRPWRGTAGASAGTTPFWPPRATSSSPPTTPARATGSTEAFAQAIQNDPLRGPGDDINAACDEAIRRYPFIDRSRQAAAGGSYGGHLAYWLEATTTRYRTLIAHAGLVNLESQWGTSDFIYSRELENGGPIWEQNPIWRDQNPVRYAGNHFKGTGWVTPMLISVGERDARVPMNNTLEAWSYLQRLQIPSRLLVFQDENHWLLRGEDSRAWYAEARVWLARWYR